MTIKSFKELTKNIPINSDIVFFPEGTVSDENNKSLLPGIGYFDKEQNNFVYLGDVAVLEDE